MYESIAPLVQEIAENTPKVHEAGKAVGRKEEYNEFWDAFFANTGTFYGKFSGNGWTAENFKPTKDIIIDGVDASNCFGTNACAVDLVEWCESLGINIVMKPSVVTGMFQNSKFTRLPVLDFSKVSSMSSTIASCLNLVTIDKLILKNDGSQTFSSTFYNDKALKNIIVEGVIGTEVKLVWSPLLSKASITSFINHLSTTTSGVSINFSKTAVDNAFETSEGAADGSTSAEWLALIGTRPNWTISLH